MKLSTRTFYRLLFINPTEIKAIYLSFPISGPRKLLEKGDSSGIKEVNAFLKKANEFELNCPQAVCFCPLTIDELPMLSSSSQKSERVFNLENRWDFKDFYSDNLLICDGSDLPKEIIITQNLLEDAEGLIRVDVASRDYLLIKQSQQLAVLNPWFKGKETYGIRNEISFATPPKPCYIYQNPSHDPHGEAKRNLKPPDPGSLGYDPTSRFIHFCDSTDELFSRLRR